jgi:nucleotide-binding universal stress UspA family protein
MAAMLRCVVLSGNGFSKESDDVFSNVLIGVDGDSGGRDAIALAKQLAAADARVTLANVYGGNWTLGRGGGALLALEREDSNQLLKRERSAASLEAELLACSAPSVGRGLHELADRHHADLLVVGSTRRGLVGRVLMGDDTAASLNGAPCAVAIAPVGYTASPDAFAKIGVGYDRSPESERALATAREFAARHKSSISALSVISLQSIPYGAEPIRGNF